jgi:hypothetical protein
MREHSDERSLISQFFIGTKGVSEMSVNSKLHRNIFLLIVLATATYLFFVYHILNRLTGIGILPDMALFLPTAVFLLYALIVSNTDCSASKRPVTSHSLYLHAAIGIFGLAFYGFMNWRLSEGTLNVVLSRDAESVFWFSDRIWKLSMLCMAAVVIFAICKSVKGEWRLFTTVPLAMGVFCMICGGLEICTNVFDLDAMRFSVMQTGLLCLEGVFLSCVFSKIVRKIPN